VTAKGAAPANPAASSAVIAVLRGELMQTLASRQALANIYVSDGCFDEAISLSEQNVAAQAHTFGPDHPFMLKARKTLDVARQAKG